MQKFDAEHKIEKRFSEKEHEILQRLSIRSYISEGMIKIHLLYL